MPTLVAVAVPAPLPGPLTYRVPEDLAWCRPGMRVRVPLGRRRITGVVLGPAEPPTGDVRLRDVLQVLDLEPVLTPELLEMVRFVADYYMAPVGEVVRSVVPSKLPPWGDRKVALTDAGALAPPGDDLEQAVVDVLLAEGEVSLAELRRRLPEPGMPLAVQRMARRGRLRERHAELRRGARYTTAVEPAAGSAEDLVARCGRSTKGRAVLELLLALGRPASVQELCDDVGCTAGVVRRLVREGVLLSFSQPERLDLSRHRLDPGGSTPRIVLRDDQAEALGQLEAALEASAYAGFLLEGMTGSGKTEVYLRAASTTLEAGRSVILLVPEIALVPALARSARKRFGEKLAILHSALSSSERQQEWERLRAGEARVVLGPRSAVFAPLEDIGLIVVDEEHDGAYKQGSAPRYHGRDLALLRARDHGAVAVVASATPSMESRLNQGRGKLGRLTLTQRVGHGELPEGIVVDLRSVRAPRKPGEVVLTEVLRAELESALDAGDQVVLLRNRRGYAPMLLCRACGEDFRCEDCGLPMTLHRREGRLRCHHCGRRRPGPRTCPACREDALEPIGAGTERVEERFRDLYPDVTVEVLDADTARRPGGAASVLERFGSGKAQVLIGTQMVAKGHHFPRVALAGVLAADTYLAFPDFRAVEKTYALLTQLAGRAGRGERPGRFVLQTWHPEHYAIRAVLEGDDAGFARQELDFRRTFGYPPFTRLTQIVVRHRSREKAERAIDHLARALDGDPAAGEIRISGPAPAPLERIQGRWRYQLLVRSPSARGNREILRRALDATTPAHGGVDFLVDVDPQDLL